MITTKLTDRQLRTLRQMLRSEIGSRTQDIGFPLPRVLCRQLERKGLVCVSEHEFERMEYGKVVARLPVVFLTRLGRETAK